MAFKPYTPPVYYDFTCEACGMIYSSQWKNEPRPHYCTHDFYLYTKAK